ncbi:hypothetical protein FSP39_016810 [Pinctada imbricata]|uniref:Fatty acid synthase n=1 Tax=Pinctada imbricata TaxID=66713 RepID=A0AA89BU94_PINIB|nr:hypothetical protein FSP39_016810 [Pinctada imbricata]
MSIHTPEETQNSEIRLRPPEKDDIVISGISCRLPESDNMEELRHHLLRGEDMVTETDRRWEPGYSSLPTHTGTIRDLTRFDTSYFGIPPKVAEVMDPQLRIMLELTQEALVDGGLLAQDLRGSRTGVFIGCGFSEAYEGFSTDPEHVKGYAPLGGTASMFANRISYSFDLKGPSYALRNGDGSSLLAVDRAVMSIRAGNCDSAIVGGCNLCLKPAASLQALDMNILSPDGRCRCYDENANGVCRSEGVVILLLQKRHAAKRVYARILHSKAMTFHESLYPPYLSHKTFLQEVYHEVGISPSDVGYVETSSSCTTDGDSEELRALADVMCKGRKSPLLIGSVKSNIGHTETASGISSLAKAVVAFHDQMIPANLHYKTPNSRIPALNDGSLKVVTERTRMHNQVVAVSSFGLGGACVHVILDSGNQPKSNTSDCDMIQNERRLLLYCGRTKEAVDYVLTHMQNNAGNFDLHYILNETANCPTTNCPFRGYVILNSEDNVREIQKCTSDKRPIWYVFSGMGSQWPGMARRMMAIPKFRQTIQYCDNILQLHGVSLMDIIMKGDENTYDRVLHSFVAIASIQVALVDLLVAMGIQPDGIVGHSVGELGCGYADGSLTAEETVLAAYWRGRCIQESNLPPGGMAAVGLTWAEAKKQCPGRVVPACHNSEKTVTISGPKEEVADFVRELKEKGVFAREVNSAGVAFHSPAMKEVAPAFLNELKKVIKPKKRSKRWISSSIPESRWSCDLAQHSSAEYHANNFQSPVLFQEAIQHIPDGAVVIEIAPHCLLQAVLKRSLGSNCSMIGLMKRGDPDNVRVFYSNLGKCYMNGVRLNPLGLITPYSFPVPRGTPMCSSLVKWDHSQTWPLSKLGDFISGGSGKQADSQFEVDVSPQSKDHYLVGHRIDGRVLYPAVWVRCTGMEGPSQYDRTDV